MSSNDFTIAHRAGKLNPADAPSRRPDYASAKTEAENHLPTLQKKLGLLPAESVKNALVAWEARQTNQSQIDEVPRGNQTVPRLVARILLGEEGAYSEGESLIEILKDLQTRDEVAAKKLEELQCNRSAQRAPLTRDGPENPKPQGPGQDSPHDQDGLVDAELVELRAEGERVAESLRENADASYQDDTRLGEPFGHDATAEKGPRDASAASARQGLQDNWSKGQDGLLRYKGRIYVPDENSVKAKLLMRYHDDPLAGHFGLDKTIELIQRKYYWPRMREDIEEYIASCQACQLMKPRRHRPYGELVSLPRLEGP